MNIKKKEIVSELTRLNANQRTKQVSLYIFTQTTYIQPIKW